MTDENKLFPGRPNYTGPMKGWFGLLHHSVLCEESHNVMERVEYVKNNKPEREIAIRLHNMIYISPAVCDVPAKCAPLDDDYWAKRDALDAEILSYIKKHIPDCAWNGEELDFS